MAGQLRGGVSAGLHVLVVERRVFTRQCLQGAHHLPRCQQCDGGRISLLANTESANPPIYGALGGLGWNITIDMQTGSSRPGYSQIIKQHLALGSKDPNAIANGALHRFTLRYVKESGIDVGDGIVQMWVDGTLVIDYNGGDPANAAYRQTWTRTNDFGSPIQFPSVLNGGAPRRKANGGITSSSGIAARTSGSSILLETSPPRSAGSAVLR